MDLVAGRRRRPLLALSCRPRRTLVPDPPHPDPHAAFGQFVLALWKNGADGDKLWLIDRLV
ncbi:hypothetical protein ACPXCE_22830 [Streptomyces sp. DT24]|uniref:hypothetical protein n=1 Tax=Streptomyces sp. DT24 TaxID=3416520 RepID=UPI003CF9CB6C